MTTWRQQPPAFCIICLPVASSAGASAGCAVAAKLLRTSSCSALHSLAGRRRARCRSWGSCKAILQHEVRSVRRPVQLLQTSNMSTNPGFHLASLLCSAQPTRESGLCVQDRGRNINLADSSAFRDEGLQSLPSDVHVQESSRLLTGKVTGPCLNSCKDGSWPGLLTLHARSQCSLWQLSGTSGAR